MYQAASLSGRGIGRALHRPTARRATTKITKTTKVMASLESFVSLVFFVSLVVKSDSPDIHGPDKVHPSAPAATPRPFAFASCLPYRGPAPR